MHSLPRTDVGTGRNDFPQVAHAADQMVPRDAPDGEFEERYRSPRTRTPARRQMGHGLVDQAEADGGHVAAKRDLQTIRRYPDDAYQGGEKPGKRGRGAANKTPFVIAVQTRDGRPIYTQMRAIAAFTKEAIKDYVVRSIASGSRVLSDGLGCFDGIGEAGLKHIVKTTGGGRPKGPDFNWVNTGLGNVKSAITGTLRSCDPQHAPRYLAAFEWRYNRRFDLRENLRRLARAAVTIAPQPRKTIIAIFPTTADTSG